MRTWDRHLRTGGLLVVLSGPSGVGKDAVLAQLESIRSGVCRSVTTTTRAMRDGEIDGVHYSFISPDEFGRRVAECGFLEHARVHGNLYGTPREWVDEHLAAGQDVILKIDVQGGLAVKRARPECVMVFLVPPSMEELERRLVGRLTETPQDLQTRLEGARKELEAIPDYDYIIENDSLERAAAELEAVIVAEHRRVQP